MRLERAVKEVAQTSLWNDKTLWGDDVDQWDYDPAFVADFLAMRIADEVDSMMVANGITKAELARRLGVSRAYVTQLLGGKPNMTLTTLAKIAIALDCEVQTTLRPTTRHNSDGSTTVELAHMDHRWTQRSHGHPTYERVSPKIAAMTDAVTALDYGVPNASAV